MNALKRFKRLNLKIAVENCTINCRFNDSSTIDHDRNRDNRAPTNECEISEIFAFICFTHAQTFTHAHTYVLIVVGKCKAPPPTATTIQQR